MKLLLTLSLIFILSACSNKDAQVHLQDGIKHLEEGDYSAASIELKNAVKLAPQSAEARFQLGKTYLALKEYEGAEKELNRAMELGYTSAQVLPLLSEAYIRTGAYSALSKLSFEDDGLTSKERAQIAYQKLISLVELGDTKGAKQLIADIRNMDVSSAHKELSLVLELQIDKNFEAALAQIKSVRERFPRNAEVLKTSAFLFLKNGQKQNAAQSYQAYLEHYPEDRQIQFYLAGLLVELTEFEKAEPIVDELLTLNEQHPLSNQLKAVIRSAEKDFPAAQQYAEQAILANNPNPALRLIAGVASYYQKDYAKSAQHLSYIASQLPDDHQGLKVLAASQLRLGKTLDAGSVLERVNNPQESDATLFSSTSFELLKTGHIKKAQELLEKSSGVTVNAEDLARLGLLQLSLNNVEGLANLEEALEKEPQLASIKETLATAYISSKRFEEALQLSKKWKEQEPENPKAYYLAGISYKLQKEFDLALNEYQQVLTFKPNDPQAELELSAIAYAKGDLAKGDTLLDEALNNSPNYIPALNLYYLRAKQLNQETEAINKVRIAQEQNSDNINLRLLLARLLMLETEFSESIDLLKIIPASESLPNTYWQTLGISYMRQGLIKEASSLYDQWLKYYPADQNAILGKLRLLDLQGDPKPAIEILDNTLEKAGNSHYQLLHAHFLVLDGQAEKARTAFEMLPENLKSTIPAKNIESKILVAEKNFESALPLALEAYAGNPESRLTILIALMYQQLGQLDKGFEFLEAHVVKYPNDLSAKSLLAEQTISKDPKLAIAAYEEIVSLNDSNYVVLNNLAYLYMDQNELDKAEKMAQKAKEIQPTNVNIVDTLAQILIKRNKIEEALRLYNDIIDKDLKSDEIYLNYVEALLADGQVKLALRQMERRDLSSEVSQTRISELKSTYNL